MYFIKFKYLTRIIANSNCKFQRMKKALLFSLVSLIVFISFSCNKKEVSAGESVTTKLNNGLSKTWQLTKMYSNGTEQTLTVGQSRYTKTYKYDNTWFDSDGYVGTYSVPNQTSIQEITTNATGGSRTINYTIKSSTMVGLDVEYTLGNTTYRLVYAQ